MGNRRVAILILMVLLLYVPLSAVGDASSPAVEQFGHTFEEVVVADSSDALLEPRDLEFHPGKVNELWIANRATDSITIVENTGMENQTSQNRRDSYRNHFLEEVSAIAFGAYDEEFDWQWGSAQESANTYCGQGSPNNFMGPTLWPSSLDHFAVEHQNDELLGSHIDMNHESPFGVGIAHDHDNAYWYNDGYYGELVYYDFQEDHDTGMDDHSDALVRRYSEIQLTHTLGTPGHMVLDKESGILYIADPGANRIVWVNTDDTTTTTQNIMSDASRLEPLEEYSRISGVEWGVLDTGLNRPSGIALEGDRLFVSTNGNGQIVAYDLSTNGKSAVEAGSIQTTASSIMGLEIGPDGHIFYVDNAQDEAVRIDPYTDGDGDGVVDVDDNCPLVANANQANHDLDSLGDVCDQDDDNDGLLDENDVCSMGDIGWVPSSVSDHDMDGCRDSTEDYDDDNDAVIDIRDDCPVGETAWMSALSTDYDGDGCQDMSEDKDDDNDGICDDSSMVYECQPSSAVFDLCLQSSLSFASTLTSDADQDGCEDRTEDEDDDNDGFLDKHDDCPNEAGLSDQGRLFGCLDDDGDGYANTIDQFPEESTQWADTDEDGYGDEPLGNNGDRCPSAYGLSTLDRLGCVDSDADGWSNPSTTWTALQGADAFPQEATQHADQDGDGFGDASPGFQSDACPTTPGVSTEDRFGCADDDGDGWSNEADMLPLDPTQHIDEDMDGFGDSIDGFQPDSCPTVPGDSDQGRFGCLDGDGDGWDDQTDSFPADSLAWSDSDGDSFPDQLDAERTDACPEVFGASTNDRFGCPDADLDGWSDAADAYPNDSMKHSASSSSTLVVGAVLALVLAGVLGGLMLVRRKQLDVAQDLLPSMPTMVQPFAPLAQAGPPLPPEGLPQGWTMEQWAWYGEDFLKNR
jgi:hypothetical protein